MQATRPLGAGPRIGARGLVLAVTLALHSACLARAAPPAQPAVAPGSPIPVPARAADLPGDDSRVCETREGYDVIVVGAGLAGLTAARELKKGGRRVLILEATHHIGGRARTYLTRGGLPIDLGGAWIHGVPTNPLTGIVDLTPTRDGGQFHRVGTLLNGPIYTEKGLADEDERKLYEEAEKIFEEQVNRAAMTGMALDALCGERERDTGFCAASRRNMDRASDYLPRDVRFEKFAHLLAANAGPLESTASLDKTSAVDVASFEAEDDNLVQEGMGTFVEAYGRGLPVCVDSPVTKILYRDELLVTVEVKDGRRYTARKALVTVPVGVLHAKKIQFEPELPVEKLKAIEEMPMGHMQKVILELPGESDPFPPQTEPNSWVLYEKNINDTNPRDAMAFVIKPFGKNVAIGFYGAELALENEKACEQEARAKPLPPEAQLCDQRAVQAAKDALRHMYGEKFAKALEAATVYVTRWSLEEYTRGAYSVPIPGAWGQPMELARPVPYRDEKAHSPPFRVYFAGEACARPIYSGSFAGAYESGLGAARSLLAELGQEDAYATKPSVPAASGAGR